MIIPVQSLAPADLATARDAAVLTFADWENRVAAGETVTPGGVLHRLLLDEGYGRYPLSIDSAGHYVVFEGCG